MPNLCQSCRQPLPEDDEAIPQQNAEVLDIPSGFDFAMGLMELVPLHILASLLPDLESRLDSPLPHYPLPRRQQLELLQSLKSSGQLH